MRTAHRVRLASILAAGAFALHQLRYLAAPEGLSQQGHRYMSDLLPAIAVLVLAGLLATLLRGTEGATSTRAPLPRRIAVFAGALLAIYFAQESFEDLLAAGQLDPGALLTNGGWISAPLAVAIGSLSALLARALEGVEGAIAIVHTRRRARSRAPAVQGRPRRATALPLSSAPLAFGLARRPPPPVAA
jgi:hypothetical protein